MQYCSTEMSGSSCCGGSGKFRQFLTKDEKIDFLKEYQSTLEKEVKGISEKIAKLQKD